MRYPALAPFALLFAAACGTLTSEGEIGGHPVRLDGTAFAWLDETVYEPDRGAWVLVERTNDDTTLHLRFTSAVFDPAVDLRTLPPAERAAILEEIAQGDFLAIDVRRGGSVRAGDVLTFDNQDPDVPETSPYIASALFSLGEPILDEESEYPEMVVRPASGLRVRLELNEVEPRLLGVLQVEVYVPDLEEDLSVAQGDVTVRFDLEPLPERLAECNFNPQGAGGQVDPCAALSLGDD